MVVKYGRCEASETFLSWFFALLATENISTLQQINISNGNLISVEASMIDSVLNVAIFATLGLCISGSGAWAKPRVNVIPRRKPNSKTSLRR
jgi:hypothetical protein